MFSIIIPPLFGAIIGYITNDIAIRMLFRPHKAKYVFGIHVPFTPGIIPKEKARIAETIGYTISNNLMNTEVLYKYLLSDGMIVKIRSSVEEFIDEQKKNQETLKTFLCHYLGEDEVINISNSINDNIAKETYTKLANPAVGKQVASVVMNHVGKMLNNDGAKILLGGIGGFVKGFNGIAASLLGVDVIGKLLSILREPTEKFLANNINTMLQEEGRQIVIDMLGEETNLLLSKPVSDLLSGHEEQLSQMPDIIESFYKKAITEHLPHILESIDISNIVTQRINEMDMNELEPIILGVMNKELSAIVWFGALLGALIGCINIFI